MKRETTAKEEGRREAEGETTGVRGGPGGLARLASSQWEGMGCDDVDLAHSLPAIRSSLPSLFVNLARHVGPWEINNNVKERVGRSEDNNPEAMANGSIPG